VFVAESFFLQQAEAVVEAEVVLQVEVGLLFFLLVVTLLFFELVSDCRMEIQHYSE
jgi:hypothetical protein